MIAIDDVVDALDQFRKAGTNHVPRLAEAHALFAEWKASALSECESRDLGGIVGVWCAGSKARFFPSTAELVAVWAGVKKDRRRGAEATNGDPAYSLGHPQKCGPSVERCFGREWFLNGVRRRAYITATTSSPDTPIPPWWLNMGYTVEIPVPRGRSPDGAGRQWCGKDMDQPFAPGGRLYREPLKERLGAQPRRQR